MKNYYEILEVDRNASQEVIEKAYKVLAKKYHPDLQQGVDKQQCAEKMKMINDAYGVLSDILKREEYNQKLKDEELQNENILLEEQERIMQENYVLKQQLNKMGNLKTNKNADEPKDEGSIINMTRVLNEQINVARKQAYKDAYIEDLKRRGYKIKYKHNFKYYLKMIGVLAIIIFVCFLIYQIPIVKQYFQSLYNENIIFHSIVDVLKNTFLTKF